MGPRPGRRDHVAALAAFRHLANGHGRDAQAGITERLHGLGLDVEGDTACRALRTGLDTNTDRAILRIYRDMAELLSDQVRPEQTLGWCEAALPGVPGEGAGPKHAQVVDDLRLSRALLRQGVGLDPDVQDRAALHDQDALDELGRLLLDGIRPPGLQGHRAATGRRSTAWCCRWTRHGFDRARAHWPRVTPPPPEGGGFSLTLPGVATDQPGP